MNKLASKSMGSSIKYILCLSMLIFKFSLIQGYDSRTNFRKIDILERHLKTVIKDLEYVKEDLHEEKEKSVDLEKQLNALKGESKGTPFNNKDSKTEVDTVQTDPEQRVYNALYDEKQERKVFENLVKSVLKDEKVNMEMKIATLNETLSAHVDSKLNTLQEEVLHSVTELNDSIASIKELTSNVKQNENSITRVQLESEQHTTTLLIHDDMFISLNDSLIARIDSKLNTMQDEVLHSVTELNDSIASIKELTSNKHVNIEMKIATLNKTLTANFDTQLNTLQDKVLHSVTKLNDSIVYITELTSNVKQNENSINRVKLESEQQNQTLLKHDAMLVSFSDSLVDVEASLVEFSHSCHDKGWSVWSSWSTCSKSCGISLQTSTRTCGSNTLLSGKCCIGTDKKIQVCTLPSCPDPKDCLELLNQNYNKVNGVYNVTSPSSGLVYPVYCDMTTDGGGWTVFQNRFDGRLDFYRTFKEYEDGFGDVNAEFWMGLNRIHEMTALHETELRIHLTAGDGSTAYQTFQDFSVSPGPDYKLRVGKTAGTAGDSGGLTYTNGYGFSTKDKDMDGGGGYCAELSHGGWWYSEYCSNVNLNGDYATPGTQSSYYSGYGGVVYYSFKQWQSLKTTTMMIRRK